MISEKNLPVSVERLDALIHEIRGLKVILDVDLARLYGVTTKRLNEQVKRNRERFPGHFMFRLTRPEFDDLMRLSVTTGNWSQSATSSQKYRGGRSLPHAFTEHGAIMAATVLNSPRAIQVSIYLVEAFVRLRGLLSADRDLARKLAALEKELKDRLDVHEAAIVTILQRVIDIIDPPALPEPSPKKGIGFQVKDAKTRYQVC